MFWYTHEDTDAQGRRTVHLSGDKHWDGHKSTTAIRSHAFAPLADDTRFQNLLIDVPRPFLQAIGSYVDVPANLELAGDADYDLVTRQRGLELVAAWNRKTANAGMGTWAVLLEYGESREAHAGKIAVAIAPSGVGAAQLRDQIPLRVVVPTEAEFARYAA